MLLTLEATYCIYGVSVNPELISTCLLLQCSDQLSSAVNSPCHNQVSSLRFM